MIPTYNERENIARVIQRCRDALEQRDFEIIVVDDDSPDKTWQVARQLFEDNEDVRVVRRRDDADLSTAVSRGFRESTKDACAVIDADLQHPPEKVPALFEALRDGADIAVGSRYHRGGGIENWPYYRKLVSKGATFVTRMGVPAARDISDPVSGFFAVRRTLLECVELEPRGYKILLEVLVKCDWDDISEVPYVFAERSRGDSNLTTTEYVRFLEHVLALGFVNRDLDTIIEPNRAVRLVEFGGIGAIGAGINTLVFLATYHAFQAGYLLAGTLAFLVAVNWNFVGNWFLTFDRPEGSILHQYVTFHGVALGGFVVYLGTLALTIDALALPAVLANTIALGAGAVVNYLGAENLAFIKAPVSLSKALPDWDNSTQSSTTDTTPEFETNVSLDPEEVDHIVRVLKRYEGPSESVTTFDKHDDIIEKLESKCGGRVEKSNYSQTDPLEK